MIRQAVFNMLKPVLEGATFFDIFAGTGIVGIEALSRGAGKAIFVEAERRQIALIERNVKHVGLWEKSDVRMADAFLWSRHFRPTGGPTIVFLGPPYELFEGEDCDRTMDLVARVQASLRPEDLLVLQFAHELSPDRLPGQEGWYRLRSYGKTRVGLWAIPSPESMADESADDDSEEE
jgi:16S rRNA (guanine(966)-N(2))-methyltransferase RsmD